MKGSRVALNYKTTKVDNNLDLGCNSCFSGTVSSEGKVFLTTFKAYQGPFTLYWISVHSISSATFTFSIANNLFNLVTKTVLALDYLVQ